MVIKTEWDLSSLYKNDHDPAMDKDRKEMEKAAEIFIKKWKNREDYLSDPKILKDALDEFERFDKNYSNGGKEGYYFWLKSAQDETDKEVKARVKKIQEFSKKIGNEMNFFTIKISKIPLKDQKKFLSYDKLAPYHHFLEQMFVQGKHVLSESEEKIMSLLSSPAHGNWVEMVSAFLAKEERDVLTKNGIEKKNFSEISTLMTNPEKKVRDSAAKAFNEIILKHRENAEAEINSILETKKAESELRNYSRPDESRHLSDDVETKMVDALVEEVSKKFSTSKKYYQLKAKLLGLSKLAYHERAVPYGSIKKEYPFEEAVRLTSSAFKQLDPQFDSLFNAFLKNGQIDVYPRKGKSGGGFCVWWGPAYKTHILLNYTNTLRDVSTIAHEMGHAIHSELSKKQNALSFNIPTSTAEVASTFMEDFIIEELENEADDETKFTLMVEKLNEDISTIFRQVACYKFEQEMHQEFGKKGYLSHEEIGKIFLKHMEAYMGDAVEQSAGSENWWVYWSHIRRHFYVYTYASGLLISKYLQRQVRKDPAFITQVKEFLSAGSSESPKTIFSKMGIDISKKEFWEQGLKEIEENLKETEALAKKLKKI